MTNEDPVSVLFETRWRPLDKFREMGPNVADPGVYVLAYSSRDLSATPVKPGDIFYVGMSHERGGIRGRLKQFDRGIRFGDKHSAAMRFYREYTDGKGFNAATSGKNFFASGLTFKCNARKSVRLGDDLRVMGDIARLEYYLLAHIKDVTGREPELNKK